MNSKEDMQNIESPLKEFNVDGCQWLGGGVSGEVFRIDEETILKLYYEGIDEDMVKREKLYAKQAFVAGLPTAISYDIVRVGNRKGILYELLGASTLNEKIKAEPEKLEQNVKLFADICKTIHNTKADAEVFPNCKKQYEGYLNQITYLSEKEKEKVGMFIRNLPDGENFVHGDLHPNNIMLQSDEPYLIDMGDLAIGNPLFDLAQTYFVLFAGEGTGVSQQALKMTPQYARKIWLLFEEFYFGATTDGDRHVVRTQLNPYLALKHMFFSTWYKKGVPEHDEMCRRELLELIR